MTRSTWLIALCVAIAPCLRAESDVPGPIVKFKHGSVRGSWLTSDENKVISAFRGIPYAKPPVKELRFKRPEPIEPWSGVLDATEDGASCIQFSASQQIFKGDEDCLFLNVYSLKKSEKKELMDLLPVMVYIHGGAFTWGSGISSDYGPQRLVDRDVMLVTFNYRVAALGFLSTEDEAAPGNYGFYDQILALRWVQDNIREFGGDPNRVTLFGESVGSKSVVLHILSPLSAGLFHAAIGESGSPICGFGILPDAKKIARSIGERLGCPKQSTSEQLINCIKRKPAVDIVVQSQRVENGYMMNFMETTGGQAYGAVAEKAGSYNDFSPFLSEDYSEQLTNGNFNKVPVILGVNKDEGLYTYNLISTLIRSRGRQQAKRIVPTFLRSRNRHLEEFDQARLYQKIYIEYFSDPTNENQTTKDLVEFYSDITYINCVDLTVQQLTSGGATVYPYKFTYAIDPPPTRFRPPETFLANGTVNHADELLYLFRRPEDRKLGVNDLQVSDLLVTLWTNFAKTGLPSIVDARLEHPTFQWESYITEKPSFLNIGLKPAVEDGYLSARTPFWDNVSETTPKQGYKREG